LRRAFGFDRNPLCRATDRLRSRAQVAVVVLIGLAPLPAYLVGHAVYQQGLSTAAAEAAHRHSVTAVTTADATGSALRLGPDTEVPVAARWTYPPGRQVHSGKVPAATGTAVGVPVRIWVDDRGLLAAPPRSSVDIIADAWFAAAGTLAGAAGFTLAGAAAARSGLDRRDQAAWRREWARVEPGWSGRPHGIDGR
jgi:hypothetical protein